MQLHVRAVEASNVPKTDFLAGSDLFMRLSITTGSATQATRIIEDTQNPIWNQEFHFALTNQSISTLLCVIANYIDNNTQKPVAHLDIPLNTLQIYDITDNWYDMQQIDGRHGCSVRIILQIAPAGHPAFQPVMRPGNIMPNPMSGPGMFRQPVMMGPPVVGPLAAFATHPTQIGATAPTPWGATPMQPGVWRGPVQSPNPLNGWPNPQFPQQRPYGY